MPCDLTFTSGVLKTERTKYSNMYFFTQKTQRRNLFSLKLDRSSLRFVLLTLANVISPVREIFKLNTPVDLK